MKIDVFSGFLGAGKTTLIKKLIKDGYKEQKLFLVENEFGQIGIDASFMRETGISISELNSGCICCSMSSNFVGQLSELIAWESPERILIEPSGVGRLSDILHNIGLVQKRCQEDEVVLNSVNTVVDAKRCLDYAANFGDFFIDQIENASCIILSRSDEVSEEQMTECMNYIRGKNPNALFITTPWEYLEGRQIIEALENVGREKSHMEEEHHHHHDGHCCCNGSSHGHGHSHHTADEVMQSWGRETPKKYVENTLKDILDKLNRKEEYGYVIRAKGILQGAEDTWYQFDYVPGDIQIRVGMPEVTGRICVIGQDLNEERLKDLFEIQ